LNHGLKRNPAASIFFLSSFDKIISNSFMPKLTRRFPLQVALVALVVYGITLSHGVTINSLSLTAKVAGWDWVPMAGQPLLWLLTLPLRLLPAADVAWALTLFSAAIAALTLGLLARSVQLLPWNQPWGNEVRRPGLMPVLLASALCGLEFSFWQEATAATGEMLDLLLLAAALWLLLEYRVRRENRWLDAATFVWGLGMAENWLMLLALPLFVAGVIRLQGFCFFQIKSLRRLAVLGLAGFSIYALLPLVNGLTPHSPWNLGQAWLASLKQTKGLVVLLYHQFWVVHWLLAIVVVLYFLVPTLPSLIRLRDEVSHYKPMVEKLQIWIYRGLRALLLAACLWLAFDPATGLRQIIYHHSGILLPLLTFDYLNALGAAFLAGDFLLLAQAIVDLRCYSLTEIQWQQRAVPFAAAAALVLLIAGLAAKNAPPILHAKYCPLQQFGELAVESLPADHGVMLSDQPQKLAVFQAALAQRHKGLDWLAVDTTALPMVAYRTWLERRHPIGWLTDENRHDLKPAETMHLLETIAHTNRLCYLQPSYGYLFERFYLKPAGAIYELRLREGNLPESPPLSAAVTETNETFWTRNWEKQLAPLVSATGRSPTGWRKDVLAEWFSVSLESWGVALQQQGRWHEARVRFEQALQLNTNNLSAQLSLDYNIHSQAGRQLEMTEVIQNTSEWTGLQRLGWLLNTCGPFDEPIFCYLLGAAFRQAGLPLQAAQQMQRTLALAPGTPAPEFALAELYNQLGLTDRARPLLNHLRSTTNNLSANAEVDLQLALLEVGSWLLQNNLPNVRSTLESVWQRHPNDARIANRVVEVYLFIGDSTNALRIVEAQLSKKPNDVTCLNRQAAILIQSGKAAAAIPVLTHVLTLTNQPEVRLNRAVARLICADVAGAEADFLELEKAGVEPARVNYGLATIAEHRQETNQALHYLRVCLTNTPAGTPLWRQASARLQAIERGLPAAATDKSTSVPKK
jgi:tetratricopeptide (TPR) repeat protein